MKIRALHILPLEGEGFVVSSAERLEPALSDVEGMGVISPTSILSKKGEETASGLFS